MGIHSKSEASRRSLLPCVKKRRRIYFDGFKHREEDGAVKWTKWLPNSQVFSSENVNQWRPRQWVDLIRRGSNEERFENGLNSQSEVRSMRALQGHSGKVRIDPKRQNNVKLPNGWTDCQCKFARWTNNCKYRETNMLFSPPWIPWTSPEKFHQMKLMYQELFRSKPIGDILKTQCIGSICRSHKIRD